MPDGVSEAERPPVCVLVGAADAGPGNEAFLYALAERLGLPICAAEDVAPEALVLALDEAGLELRSGDAPRKHGVRVDFRARVIDRHGRRRPGHASRRQPIVQAIGREPKNVVDATAGFGDDAIALASLGHRVRAIERSPVVAELLADARRRALDDPALREIAERLDIRCGDSRRLLAKPGVPPDAVYIDPMYPQKRSRSALPRRQIQLLRRLVGDDPDACELLRTALSCGATRVVVKRPVRAASWWPAGCELRG